MATRARTILNGHELVLSEGSQPERWMLFLHGILGTRGNWRSFARQWVHRRPDWGAVLVDLRHHGESAGLAWPPPETVAACAADLDALVGGLEEAPVKVRGVLGHSFGGKVALEWIARRRGDLDVALVLDTNPGARPDARGSEAVVSIVSLLARTPKTLPERAGFTRWLEAEGVARPIAQWLAMNVRRRADGSFELGLDLAAIEALLGDYFLLDRWDVLESPPGRTHIDFVMGERSPVLLPEDRARLRAAAAKNPGRLACHELAGAGHWVHVDAPLALLEIVIAGTSRS